MHRYRLGFLGHRAARGAAFVVALVLAGACELATGPDDKPTTAMITIDGSSSNPLKLITSTDLFEQFNTGTLEYTPVLLSSDTIEITLPYSATMSMGPLNSIYVELLQPATSTATVHMKVDLDNGEGYEQNATLADRAALIYYFIFTQY